MEFVKMSWGTLECLRVCSSRSKPASHSIQSSRERASRRSQKESPPQAEGDEGGMRGSGEKLPGYCISFPFEDGWRRKQRPTLVLLPGDSHGRRSPVGCGPWGRRDFTGWVYLKITYQLLIRWLRIGLEFISGRASTVIKWSHGLVIRSLA